MTKAAVHHEKFPDTHHSAEANLYFGFWVYLMTDFILFATLFAAYSVLKNNTNGGATGAELFNLPYVVGQTLILLASSFTCGMAMVALQRAEKNRVLGWFALTFLFGLSFLIWVVGDLAVLVQEGNTWKSNAFLSSYFTLAGLHALHIVFGLLFMILFNLQVKMRGLIPLTIRRITCLSMFWFFSYVVWIFMFTIVYLIGASS